MPLAPMNFQPSGDPIAEGLIPAIQRGMQLYYAPKQNQADLALKQAQTQRAQQQASMPFGGQTLPGAAGDVLGLESIKQLFGDNSPQYQQALKAFNLNQQSALSRIGYQNALAGTLPERALTPTGKGFVESTNVSQGLLPTGAQAPAGSNYNPQEASNTYGLVLQKGSSDTDTRKRNLFATNIEKTLQQIDPDALTQYAGLEGAAKKALEQGKAPFGQESKQFDDYQNSAQAVKLLVSQIRQFYGDSIQPDARKNLEVLSNPASWSNNPKLARQMYDQTIKALRNEMSTYQQALKNKSAYQGVGNVAQFGMPNVTPEQVANSPLAINPQQQTNLVNSGIAQQGSINTSAQTLPSNQGLIQVVMPDGSTWNIPKGKLKDAMARGARQVTNG